MSKYGITFQNKANIVLYMTIYSSQINLNNITKCSWIALLYAIEMKINDDYFELGGAASILCIPPASMPTSNLTATRRQSKKRQTHREKILVYLSPYSYNIQ